jgi:hypothetical protein
MDPGNTHSANDVILTLQIILSCKNFGPDPAKPETRGYVAADGLGTLRVKIT